MRAVAGDPVKCFPAIDCTRDLPCHYAIIQGRSRQRRSKLRGCKRRRSLSV